MQLNPMKSSSRDDLDMLDRSRSFISTLHFRHEYAERIPDTKSVLASRYLEYSIHESQRFLPCLQAIPEVFSMYPIVERSQRYPRELYGERLQ